MRNEMRNSRDDSPEEREEKEDEYAVSEQSELRKLLAVDANERFWLNQCYRQRSLRQEMRDHPRLWFQISNSRFELDFRLPVTTAPSEWRISPELGSKLMGD